MEQYSVQWLDPRATGVTEPPAGSWAWDLNNNGVALGGCYYKPPAVNVAAPPPPEAQQGSNSIVFYPDRTEVDPLPFWISSLNDFGDFVGWTGGPLTADGYVVSGGTTVNLRSKFGVAKIWPACVNNRGVIAGGFLSKLSGNVRAFVYNAATTGGPPTSFDLLRDGSNAYGWAINEKDHVLGYRANSKYPRDPEGRIFGAQPQRTFLYADGAVIELGEVAAFGFNDDDVVVGGRQVTAGAPQTAFVLKADAGELAYEDLGVLPGLGHDSSCATDINNAGDIVGISRQNGRNPRPFLLPKGGTMQDLNELIPPELEWTLSSAVRINDSGQILCNGVARHLGHPRGEPGPLCCVLTPERHIAFAKPERYIGDHYSLTGGTGWVVFRPGSRPVPINPNELRAKLNWNELSHENREVLVKQAVDSLGMQFTQPEDRRQVEDAMHEYFQHNAERG